MEAAAIENLSFTYNAAEKAALSGVSFTVQKGELVLLCGESGCGKTTLLRMLKPQLTPKGKLTGEVRLFGKNVNELSEYEGVSRIGFVMQSPEKQTVTQRVYSELALGLESIGADRDEILRKTGETAAYFGIEKLYRRDTMSLSGGEKQLVSIASVLACEPDLLILDEPTARLDPIAARELTDTVCRLNRELGITVIISEHITEGLFGFADKVAVLDSGRMMYFGRPCESVFALRSKRASGCFPISARLYAELGFTSSDGCPLNIGQGRRFLSERVEHCYYNEKECKALPCRPTVLKNAVELHEVYFRYDRDGEDIVRGASLTVNFGEVYTILGGNGSGKTTLLGIISGLIKPYAGKVTISGRRLSKYRSGSLYKGMLAAVPQNPTELFVKDTVREELEEMHNENGTQSFDKEMDRLCGSFGLNPLLDMHPYDLSGGEQHKLAAAKAMLSFPKILLLDEPTSGLDCTARAELVSIIRRLAAEGTAVIVVTHDADFAADCSDRCGFFFDGRIISEESVNEFFLKNTYYTTSAVRLTRGIIDGCVTYDDVYGGCMENGVGENKKVR